MMMKAPLLLAGAVFVLGLGLAGCKKRGIDGHYVGKLVDGKLTYDITVDMLPAPYEATVWYGQPFGCKSKWTLTGHDQATETWSFREDIKEQGPKACATGGTVSLTQIGVGGGLFYSQGAAHGSISLSKR